MAEDQPVAFIVAGVQKAGTTALFDYLSEDSRLSLSRVKEVHFFDDESHDWSQPDYAAYHAHFEPPALELANVKRGDGRLRGEATPIYLYWPNSLERIAAYNPAMRLIILLRDPVERAWSHWKMEYARGAETKPFAWCIREGRQRLFSAQPWGHHREFSYVERGFYAEQLERLFAVFPRDQVLLLQADDLNRDPAMVLARVWRFLNLDPGPAPQARQVHVGREMDYGSVLTVEDAAFLREVYAADQARLSALLELGSAG
jgi:hypothetical protein